MTFPRTCFFALVVLASNPLQAQTPALQDDAAPDAKTLTEHLKTFAKTREQNRISFLERARQQLAKPVQTPGAAGNYVLDCMRTVRFQGQEGGNAEFAEWKKTNRTLFSDRNLERASELYLRYLALTLRRATLPSAEPVQTEVWTYLDLLNSSKDLIANVMREKKKVKMTVYDPKEDKVTGEIVGNLQDNGVASAANAGTFIQDLLNQSVSGGLVAQAMELSSHLDNIPSWEMVPGNFSGIMEANIRPLLREKKDPKLLATWDYEISFLGAIAEMRKEMEKFRRETYPKLIWKKAADVELLGLENRALNIRLDIAQKYPEHPDFATWTGIIETQLKALQDAEGEKKAKAAELESIQPLPPDGTANSSGDSPFGTN